MTYQDFPLLALQLLHKHGLHQKGWTFEWSRAKKCFGVCIYSQKKIKLSLVLAKTETPDAMMQTLLHEIAHALTPGAGHGREWKRVASEIGVRNPKATRSYTGERPEHLWELVCDGRVIKRYHRKPSRSFIESLPRRHIVGKPETKGRLQLVACPAAKKA
ncbi:MAG: SprT-like domain-containing protein [bacterium]